MATLYIVATPIGNLEDISLRALRILKESEAILCEDTRVTRKLLDHYQISTPTVSYHQHSGQLKTDKIKAWLLAGKNLALVTDAGTPGISDPGSLLVTALREDPELDIKLESVPGPSALTAAVSLAGVGFDRFLFLGFLPHKKGRQTKLQEIISSDYPVVVYESKHRIIKLLDELALASATSGRPLEVIVTRELTKLHESIYSGSPETIKAALELTPSALKGEFVVLIK